MSANILSPRYGSNNLLRDFVRGQTDENLKVLDSRLTYRLPGDIPEALGIMSYGLDEWLASAESAGEFFDMIDHFATLVEKECVRRFG